MDQPLTDANGRRWTDRGPVERMPIAPDGAVHAPLPGPSSVDGEAARQAMMNTRHREMESGT